LGLDDETALLKLRTQLRTIGKVWLFHYEKFQGCDPQTSLYCVEAMKLRDFGSPEHGTSVDLNLTHPVFVKKTELLSGVGTSWDSRTGGINTETIRSPTRTPANNHKSDIITLMFIF
jgi:hypothetical protein